jgi:hypothetical protein
LFGNKAWDQLESAILTIIASQFRSAWQGDNLGGPLVFMGHKGMMKKFSLCRSYGMLEHLVMVLGC